MSEEKLDDVALEMAMATYEDSKAGSVESHTREIVLAYLAAAPKPAQGFVPDWSKAPDWATDIGIYWHSQGATKFYTKIPRPAPAKLTPEEIEEEARKVACDAFMVTGTSDYADVYAAIDAYLAKKAELDALASKE